MPNKFDKERTRTLVLIVIGFLLLLYIIVSEKLFFEAKVYGALFLLSILTIFAFPYLWKHSAKKESLEESYIGVNKKIFIGIFIGVVSALLFLILTRIEFFSSVANLITPTIPLSLFGSGVVVILIAGLIESLFYLGSLLSVLNLYMPFWISAILQSIIFVFSHYYSYVIVAHTTLLFAFGAFFGAFVFGLMSAYLAKYFGIQSAIVSHMVFNAVTFLSTYQLLSIVG